MIPIILIATLITFGLVFLIPGDPAARIAGPTATPEQVAKVSEDFGFDRPVLVRYGSYVGNLVQGDLGASYTYDVPVTSLIADRLPPTLSLSILAIIMAVVMGIPAGVLSGRSAGRWQDRLITVLSTMGLATPNFVLALLLIMVLAIQTPFFPATGYQPVSAGLGTWLQHLILPAFALAVLVASEIARQLRGTLVTVMGEDYIRTAVAKGVPNRMVTAKHGLKNALIPVVTVMGLQIAYLIGGTAVIESVFGISGLGDLAVHAVLNRDLPVIQGIVILTVLVTLTATLLVDLTYGYLNPKVRRA